MAPSLEGWPTKAKEELPHDVKLTPLNTKPMFEGLVKVIFQSACINRKCRVAYSILYKRCENKTRRGNAEIKRGEV